MKLSQLCIGSAAVILIYSSQVNAAAPAFDSWTVTSGTITSGACDAGFTCGTAMTDAGFYQRMVTDTSSGPTYFQTIITEPPNATIHSAPTLTCPDSFTCGDIITGPDFVQLEFTDGTSTWFNTIKSDMPTTLHTYIGTNFETGPRLFHTQTGLTLKPGQHLITTYGESLADFASNLNIDPTKLTTDLLYTEEQNVGHEVVDAEISGVENGGDAKLSTQLDGIYILLNYKIIPRVLTIGGWSDFTIDDHNQLLTAEKLDSSYCPDIESPLYQNNFDAGSKCLRITVQDGGPNDGDGMANGSVALTLGLVFEETPLDSINLSNIEEPTLTTTTTTQDGGGSHNSDNGDSGGGGAWSWWLSLAIFLRLNKARTPISK